MPNSVVMSAEAPRIDRAIGWRWLRLAVREVLLALHQSRRQMARRIIREQGHLRVAADSRMD